MAEERTGRGSDDASSAVGSRKDEHAERDACNHSTQVASPSTIRSSVASSLQNLKEFRARGCLSEEDYRAEVARQKARLEEDEELAFMLKGLDLAGESHPVPTLRGYQKELIRSVERSLKKHSSVLAYLPTGGGKTVVAVALIMRFTREGKRCMFVVNRCTLVQQTARALDQFGLQYGFIKAGLPECIEAPVQIASIQSLARRCSKTAETTAVDFLVIDEAHAAVARQYRELRAAHPGAIVVGLTATPFRTDPSESLGAVFDECVEGPSVSTLIARGFLVPPRVYAPPFASGSGSVAASERGRSLVFRHWSKRCAGRRTVAFCKTRKDSMALAKAFTSRGVAAEHVDGKTGPDDRTAAFGRLQSGETLLLTSVDVLSEGFDMPSVSAVLLLRPTTSKRLFIQQVGRGLRLSPGKQDCVVMDMSGCTLSFGPITGPVGYAWERVEKNDTASNNSHTRRHGPMSSGSSKAKRSQAKPLSEGLLVRFCGGGCGELLHRAVGRLCVDCKGKRGSTETTISDSKAAEPERSASSELTDAHTIGSEVVEENAGREPEEPSAPVPRGSRADELSSAFEGLSINTNSNTRPVHVICKKEKSPNAGNENTRAAPKAATTQKRTTVCGKSNHKDGNPITCKDCSQSFVFSAQANIQYAKKGWKPPLRCQACRRSRRQRQTKRSGSKGTTALQNAM